MSAITEKLNAIQKDVASGKEKADKGALRILACLYQLNFTMPIFKNDIDVRNDFYLAMYPTLCNLFSFYDPNKGTFSTYLYNALIRNAHCFLRQKLKEKAKEQSYIRYYLEEKMDCTEYDNQGNSTLCVNSEEPEYSAKGTDNQPQKDFLFYHNRYSRREQILVLAMKSAFYLTPNLITKLSRETGFSENELWDFKKQIDNSINKKIENHNKSVCLRNASYFNKNRCQIELNKLKQNSFQYPEVQKAYSFYKKQWQHHIEKRIFLKRIVPSNKTLSLVLHIPETRILRMLKKTMQSYQEID